MLQQTYGSDWTDKDAPPGMKVRFASKEFVDQLPTSGTHDYIAKTVGTVMPQLAFAHLGRRLACPQVKT